jgi:DNA repair protein SbcD/Mre11
VKVRVKSTKPNSKITPPTSHFSQLNLQFIKKIYNEKEGGILMRFIHMADIHFDSPFTVLASRNNLANIRRLEQREAFKKAIEYIKVEKIPFLFISGDLYEQEYIRESTIEYINNLFKTIPETRIFISPGNHDPFLSNSFYNTFNWNKNVTIFNSEIKIIETEEVDIYGFGFTDFYCENSRIEEIKLKNKNKINILITHGALDASKTLDMQYNPLNSNKLKEIGFDYIALGHIHKANYENNRNNFIYPGSLISFGFDELGEHGFLDIKINKNNSEIKNKIEENKINNSEIKNKIEENKINNLEEKNYEKDKIEIKFLRADERKFEEESIDISSIKSEEELIEKLDEMNLEEENFYKIILKGTKKIELNETRICKLTQKDMILKVRDKTETEYNIDNLAMQKNLKGMFVKNLLEKLKSDPQEEDSIKKAMEIGLKLFK